jgi:hypothetical protein
MRSTRALGRLPRRSSKQACRSGTHSPPPASIAWKCSLIFGARRRRQWALQRMVFDAAACGGRDGPRRGRQVLLACGADRTLRNVWGGTPAGTARYFGHDAVARLIESP